MSPWSIDGSKCVGIVTLVALDGPHLSGLVGWHRASELAPAIGNCMWESHQVLRVPCPSWIYFWISRPYNEQGRPGGMDKFRLNCGTRHGETGVPLFQQTPSTAGVVPPRPPAADCAMLKRKRFRGRIVCWNKHPSETASSSVLIVSTTGIWISSSWPYTRGRMPIGNDGCQCCFEGCTIKACCSIIIISWRDVLSHFNRQIPAKRISRFSLSRVIQV